MKKCLFITFFISLSILLFSDISNDSPLLPKSDLSNLITTTQKIESVTNGTIKIFNAIAAPFPPFTNPEGDNPGMAWEISKAALESQGYTVSLVFTPWARALKSAIAGEYDGLIPAYWTGERTEWFHFPSSVAISHIGFLKLKSRTDITFNGDLKTMTEYEIGVGRGYSTSEKFDRAQYLKKVEVTTTPQILKMLWFGRLDLAVGGFEYSLDYLNSIDSDPEFVGIKDEIILMTPVLDERELFLAISRKAANSEEKLADFNRGMIKIKQDGTYEQILQKYNISEVQH